MNYQGVMFDMDGLLLDTERLVVDAFRRTAVGFDLGDIGDVALQMIGLEACQCVAFEDSDPGATAAISSGAHTVQVPDINPPSDLMREMGHLIADDLLNGARQIGLIV